MNTESISKALRFEIGQTYKGSGDVKGVDFKLLKRKNNICLFERSDLRFEVIELKNQKENTTTIGGVKVTFKEKEVYPSGESWNGACLMNLTKAEEVYKKWIRD